jgi:DUF4097 and DUF4098 domain-containing protein YvlB
MVFPINRRHNMKKLFLAFGFLLSSCIANEEITRVKISEPITRIELDLDTGDITLSPTTSENTELTQTLHFTSEKPQTQIEVIDGVLHITSACVGAQWVCGADFEVKVPSSISALAVTSTGDIRIENLLGVVDASTTTGDIEISEAAEVTAESNTGDITISGALETSATVTTGDITLRDLTGNVEAISTTGDIEAENILGDAFLSTTTGDISAQALSSVEVSAETNTGDINLDLISEVESLSANATTGDIFVSLPTGEYNIETSTTTGDVSISQLLNTNNSIKSINANTNTGDITLQGR